MKKINFKQPKYVIPTIVYMGALVVGYLVIDLFNVEVKEKGDKNLQTTEYLNADLPNANVSSKIGSKRQNVKQVFGDIHDRSAVMDIVEDPDSVRKKEDFESKYSEEELRLLEEQKRQQEEIKRLKELNDRLSKSSKDPSPPSSRSDMGSEDFVLPMSDAERERALAQRRSGMMADLESDLGNVRGRGASHVRSTAEVDTSSVELSGKVVVERKGVVHELDEDDDGNIVVKKMKEDSESFNTLSENAPASNIITAIIDEEIKVQDGSRVRLRLLDDIGIGGVQLSKGSYLYATMGNFGKQRVKGTVSSVLVGDEILKIRLSIYDVTDGQEGLYVPQSQFRETAKDIGSSAMQGSLSISNGTPGNSFSQWANQGVQNAVQRTTNAISKAIKKNHVRLKYGTHVYLVNSAKQTR